MLGRGGGWFHIWEWSKTVALTESMVYNFISFSNFLTLRISIMDSLHNQVKLYGRAIRCWCNTCRWRHVSPCIMILRIFPDRQLPLLKSCLSLPQCGFSMASKYHTCPRSAQIFWSKTRQAPHLSLIRGILCEMASSLDIQFISLLSKMVSSYQIRYTSVVICYILNWVII